MEKPSPSNIAAAAAVCALGVLAAALFITGLGPPQAALIRQIEPRGATPAERAIFKTVMVVLERECPAIARLGLRDVQHTTGGEPTHTASIFDARGGWFQSAPFAKVFGWRKAVGMTIPLKEFPRTISLSAGGGRRPGIASRTAGGYDGQGLCALDEAHGEYTFRAVPALAIIDQLP